MFMAILQGWWGFYTSKNINFIIKCKLENIPDWLTYTQAIIGSNILSIAFNFIVEFFSFHCYCPYLRDLRL